MNERIRQRMKVLGLNAAQVAREVGISPQAMRKIVSGETSHTAKINNIAKVLETTPEYLAGESDAPTGEFAGHATTSKPALSAEISSSENLISLLEIKLNQIDETIHEGSKNGTVRHFDREWLRRFTATDPARLVWCEGLGDSMSPYILPPDIILIDTSDLSLRVSDQIWVFALGGCIGVRRLRPVADRQIKMISDNQAISDDIAPAADISLIGRVVAVIRHL